MKRGQYLQYAIDNICLIGSADMIFSLKMFIIVVVCSSELNMYYIRVFWSLLPILLYGAIIDMELVNDTFSLHSIEFELQFFSR